MPGITRYEVLHFGPPVTELYGPGVPFSRVIWGRREGIGKKVIQPTTSLLSVTVKEFRKTSYVPGAVINTATEYFTLISRIDILGVRHELFQVGPTVTPGNKYSVTKNGVTATYTVIPGDTAATVTTNLTAVIGATVFSPAYTSISNPAANQINLRGNTSYSTLSQILRPTLTYFQNGYYIPSSGLPSPTEWLIESHTQTSTFFTLGAIGSSYAFSALIPLPFGLGNYLNIPGTTTIFYDTNASTGSTNITGVPAAPGVIDDSVLVYDEVTGKVMVSSDVPFGNGERINIFYS